MVMQVMNAIESLKVGDAQEASTVMVLPVVDEGKIVVSRVESENQQARHIGGERESGEPPDRHGDEQEDEEPAWQPAPWA